MDAPKCRGRAGFGRRAAKRRGTSGGAPDGSQPEGRPKRSFLTQDPIGLAGGVNLYAYAGNNPTNYADPFGLSPICPPCIAAVAAAWALYEVGSGLYDAYRAGKTLADPSASIGTKARSAGLAAVGLVAPGGGFTALDDLADAAKALDKGGQLTKAGRALEKHGSRPGSVYPRATGAVAEKNAAGQAIVEDILTSPGARTVPLMRGRHQGGADI